MADHVTIYEKELQRKINEHKESEKSPIVSKAAEIKCTDLQTVTKKHECAVSNCVVSMCIIRHCENVWLELDLEIQFAYMLCARAL